MNYFLARVTFGLVALCCALATPGKPFRYASQIDAGTMDPHALAAVPTTRVLGQIYEPLVGRDEQFQLEPRLALSWATIDGGRGWRFRLRPDVKFHEGEPFTADDVVFNVTRALQPTSAYRIAVPNVTGAVKVDDLTVDILTSQPTPVLPFALVHLRLMSKGWCAKHHVEKPQDYKMKEESYAARHANGTGPYKLVRWDPDVKAVLVANESYYGKRGNVTEATFFVIGSSATRAAALISGEMDFVIDPAVQDLERLRAAPGIKVEQGVSYATQFLGFDHARDTLIYGNAGGRNPFRDVRVRKAVSLAIDRSALQAKTMRGTAGIGLAIFSPSVDGYDKRFDAKPEYDTERAKQLLWEAGYRDGFTVDLDCGSQPPADALCQAISSMLSRVGVHVAYKPLAFNALLPKLTAGDTSLYSLAWMSTTYEPEGFLLPLAHTRNGPGLGDSNFGNYSNPEVDSLIDKGRLEFDPAKRAKLFSEAMMKINDDVAYVPLVYRHITWAMRKNVTALTRPNDTLDLRFVTIE